MAIKPWSWTASNGTASAAQTKRAYNALISGGNTSLFSHYVWNDLVNKVNEVSVAIGGAWDDSILKKSKVTTYQYYGNLTAEMFNALRQNTRYQSWTWNYDKTLPGYIGRTDFKGTATYGEDKADIVYGRYFLELVERLNLVIEILNNTAENITETDGQLMLSLLLGTDLTAGVGGILTKNEQLSLQTSPLLEADNLPTWTLNIEVPTPQLRAYLESEDISSMTEAYVYLSSNLHGRLHRLPPVALSQFMSHNVFLEGLLRTNLPRPFIGGIDTALDHSADIAHGKANILSANLATKHSITANGITDYGVKFGWQRIRLDLNIKDTITAERKYELDAPTKIQVIHGATFGKSSPTGINAEAPLFHRSVAEFGVSEPFGINAAGEQSVSDIIANLTMTQFSDTMNAIAEQNLKTALAKLDLDHVSTMLRAYLEMVQNGTGVLHSFPSSTVIAKDAFSVSIPAEMVADFAPILEWATDIALTIESDAVTATAGILRRDTAVKTKVVSTAHTAVAGIAENAYKNIRHRINGTAVKGHSASPTARNSMRSSVGGNANIPKSENLNNVAILLFTPEIMAELNALHGVREILIDEKYAVNITGNTEVIKELSTLIGINKGVVSSDSNLGYVYYANLSAITELSHSTEAFMVTEGGGWQYPTYDSTDLTVYQVYLTEQENTHLFLDPVTSVSRVSVVHSISADVGVIRYAGIGYSYDYAVTVKSTVHGINRTTWQHPVLDGNNLSLYQSLDCNHKKYLLEVI